MARTASTKSASRSPFELPPNTPTIVLAVVLVLALGYSLYTGWNVVQGKDVPTLSNSGVATPTPAPKMELVRPRTNAQEPNLEINPDEVGVENPFRP